MLERIRTTYSEYPGPFWALMGATLVDNLGRFLLFPYFSLYLTNENTFNASLTQVGILFAIFSATSMVGGFIGGAFTDKFGRKSLLLFGLITSALSSILMAFVTDLTVFYILAGFVGLLSNVGGPAQQAMIADLLPAKKLADGYGMNRVAFNISATIGPALGGILASIDFVWLFIFDAVTSLITAAIVYRTIPETKPQAGEEHEEQSLPQTIGGYGKVLGDGVFMAYVVISILVTIVYVQMNSTMPVYLNQQHGIPPSGYGALLSMNAAIVVFFQFWITRRISKFAPMYMMALGTLFYAVGFGMFGFGSGLLYFALAMIVITIGEMILAPVGQALVARFSPVDMRGRYMAIFGFTWGISFAVGPLLAGYVSDTIDPNWVWYGGFFLAMIGVLGYLFLRTVAADRLQETEEAPDSSDSAHAAAN
ncbi:MAG: MFS transporter [Chloroflexi bacterium]|nr:MFS transporter [Chloroflexota bacterium]